MPAAPLTSTGDGRVDGALGALVAAYEGAFPGQVRVYYLYGSATDGTRGPLSDLDVGIVFRGAALDPVQLRRARDLLRECQSLSPIRLDCGFAAEGALDPADVRLKAGTVLLHGDDIRDAVPWPTVAAYRRRAAAGPLHFIVRHLRGAEWIAYPVGPPDPADDFAGYADVRIPHWYPPGTAHGTKELVATVCWTATALVALRTGRFVATRAEAVSAYAEDVGDEWTDLVHEVHGRCARTWTYAVPADAGDRASLSALCRRVAGFENRFLVRLREYLLDELRSGDLAGALAALGRLAQVVYPDTEVERALRREADAFDPERRDAAAAALARRSAG